MAYKILIIDDEALARRRLRSLLSKNPALEVIGECANGEEAVLAILDSSPDLIFLDVQMPEMNGFEVLEAVGRESMPAVVFVTAHDQYALKAFEVHAVDYLLKPFSRDRLEQALSRAVTALENRVAGDLNRSVLALLDKLKEREPYAKRLLAKAHGRIHLLPVNDIEWIEAEDYYARVHLGQESFLIRESLSGLQKRLDPSQFLRIHRSSIINVRSIKELQSWFHGEYLVILKNGTKMHISRNYQKDVLGALKG
ncbi:MAG: LytTR family DNA-binding domain-containing protein [Candidatus Aminicenantales bacterium]